MLLALVLAAAPATTQRVDFIFGGDFIPHDPVKYVAALNAAKGDKDGPQGWDFLLASLEPHFRKADVAVVNLETPLTNDAKAVTAEMLFNALPSMARGLKARGVTVATFANNHCLDQHAEGIVETRKWLGEVGLLTAGCDATEALSWEPLIIEKNGLRVGILAFTRYLNLLHGPKEPGQPHVPLVHYDDDLRSGGLDQRELLPKVKAAAAKCDALIVIPHWGDEYATQPRADDRLLAAQLVEAGAVAVIGMHPHVVQPLETVARPDGSEAFVAFSIGNLVSNQDWTDVDSLKRDGLLIRLSLVREGKGPVVLRDVAPIPIWTENAITPKRVIQPVLVDEEISRVQEAIAALDAKSPRSARSALVERLKLMQRRREAIFGQVPLELGR